MSISLLLMFLLSIYSNYRSLIILKNILFKIGPKVKANYLDLNDYLCLLSE